LLTDDPAAPGVGREVLKKEVERVKGSGQSSHAPDPDSKLFVMKSDVCWQGLESCQHGNNHKQPKLVC